MTLTEQTCAQAALLAGKLQPRQEQLLMLLCRSAVNSLAARLRHGLQPEDCKADFIAAASLYALAALSEVDDVAQLDKIQIGDVTMQRGGRSAAASCLRKQAALLMDPYCEDHFAFRRV
ncbi:MAG: hypothetical protein IJ448_02225 [Oscillospiraceae bacterium]|nr:hypothetical protein [Oscillospiraceae bacterium]